MNKKRYSEKAKKLSIYLRKAVICLAVLVIFITSYMMTLPAIAISKETAADDPAIVLDTETPGTEENQDTVQDDAVVNDEQDDPKEQPVYEQQVFPENEMYADPVFPEKELNEDEIVRESSYFYDDSTDVAVLIEAPYGAFPEGTTMTVSPVEYDEIEESVTDAVDGFSYVQAVDITFYYEGEAIEPALPIKVSFVSSAIKKADESLVLHISDEGETDVVALSEEETKEDELVFESQDFSTYVIVYTEIEKTFISADGQTYKATVSYGPEAEIPNDAALEVEEILPDTEEYENYLAKIEETLEENETVSFARFFDISILSNGVKIQLADSVEVKVELTDVLDQDVTALHFKENEEIEVLDAEVIENEDEQMESAVVFTTDGFSVYAIAVLENSGGDDPFGLDGQSFGIVNNNNTVSGRALMTGSANSDTRLTSKEIIVRIDVVGRQDEVFVANNSEIVMWSFTSAGNGQYYITTEVGGNLKYLSIGSSGLKLVNSDEIDNTCRITVEAGTGAYTGKYRFKSGNRMLKLNGSNFESAGVASNDYAWMYFAELSNLHDDDFVNYTATKVSISSAENDVKDGDTVIIYTRIWNDVTKRYDYYVIDYDGMLVKAYEGGDTISWVGSKVNTMLWDFTEYHYAGTSTPNGYYEFENDVYPGTYLAPQYTESTEANTVRDIIQSRTIGVLLKGRENDEYYSTILAWDGGEDFFDYASIKVNEDTIKLEPGAFQRASTFYFAVMKEKEATQEDKLTTVETIDHKSFGITIKIQDYENINSNNRSKDQVNVLGDTPFLAWTGTKNLLKSYLEEQDNPETGAKAGYPMTNSAVTKKTEQSLYKLYNNSIEVGQQFLLSTYNETGYFEYDSTQNFAHLIWQEDDPWLEKQSPSGRNYELYDFVIYDQLGTTTQAGDTRQHGQFYPFNDLVEGRYVSWTNNTDIHANPLSSLDPRKGEKLYAVQNVNGQSIAGHSYADSHYNNDPTQAQILDVFFGVEMTASFMQNESGEDAWGHDLIFEFSGDDDFWFYVDDVLILDLGGIHSALDGSINFKTGKVVENGSKTLENGEPRNLRNLFKRAYKEKYPNATDAEVNTWLNDIFEDDDDDPDNGNNGTVFKPYSGHTMKMFYMERGAGASNIHMRFNLAPYNQGEVLLEKKVTGSDVIDQKFAYQIFYQKPNDPRPSLLGSTKKEQLSVIDYLSKEPLAKYDDDDSIASDSCFVEHFVALDGKTYDNVFLLDPGQVVAIQLGSETDTNREDIKYTIRECGVDTETYDSVKANGSNAYTFDDADDKVKDYISDPIIPEQYSPEDEENKLTVKVSDRKKVVFENHVDSRALKNLTITKRLWEDENKTREIFSGDEEDCDNTTFKFRIYVGVGTDKYVTYTTEEGTYNIGLAVYNAGTYYVKDSKGHYCWYEGGKFVPTEATNILDLSDEIPEGELKSPREKATFTTSPGGAAEQLRTGYSIEIPDLINGTPYYIEERSGETPVGYNLINYTVTDGPYSTYQTDDEGHVVTDDEGHPVAGNVGTVINYGFINPDMAQTTVSVHNQHGYTLLLKKVWSDADFMEDHDYIYFGVYLDGQLVDGSIRRLGKTDTEIKWFYPELDAGKTLNDYLVYELKLGGSFSTNETTGVVTPGEDFTVTALQDGGTLVVGGTTNEHGYSDHFEYTVTYQRQTLKPEEIEQKVTSRTDTVKNSRPGLKLIKTNMNGVGLEGGMFTFVKKGDPTSQKTFISGEDGLIAVAYLTANAEYVLTETVAPFNYAKLIEPLTIKQDENGTVYINGETTAPQGAHYSITQVAQPTATNMPAVYIQNKPITLRAIKIDAINSEPIEDVVFELHREVLDYQGNPMPDYNPMYGFETLKTGEDGIIPKINLTDLNIGHYYLRETETPYTHEKLDYDIYFEITQGGQIVFKKAQYVQVKDQQTGQKVWKWVKSDITDGSVVLNIEDGDTRVMTLQIKNQPSKVVRILKKNYLEEILPGATFSLYKLSQIDTSTEKPKEGEEPILTRTTDSNGIIDLGALSKGTTHYLYETEAPESYILLQHPIKINTTASGTVTATYNNKPLTVTTKTQGTMEISEIVVFNSNGYELPASGGAGRSVYYIAGACLIAVAVLLQKRTK